MVGDALFHVGGLSTYADVSSLPPSFITRPSRKESMFYLFLTTVSAASTGTCVKLAMLSCGVLCSPRILSTKRVEFLTV